MVIHDCTTLCALRAIHGPLRFLLRPEPFFVGLPRSAAPSRTQVFTNVPHLLRCFPFLCHPGQQSSSRRWCFFFMESLSPHRRMLIIYIIHIHGTNTSQHKEHVCDTRPGLWWKQRHDTHCTRLYSGLWWSWWSCCRLGETTISADLGVWRIFSSFAPLAEVSNQ